MQHIEFLLKILSQSTWLNPAAIPLIYLDITGVVVRRIFDWSHLGCVKELHKFLLVKKSVIPAGKN